MATRWTDKSLQELLETLSDNGKNFLTKESKTKVKSKKTGYSYPTRGRFKLYTAYEWGYKLIYVPPYTGGVRIEVTQNYLPPGKMAELLMSMGGSGLKSKYNAFEKEYKQSYKASFERKEKQ